MAPKSKINCMKCVKLLKTSKDNLSAPSVKILYDLNVQVQVQKNSQNTKKEKQNLFANFALTTPVLNVIGMLSMVRKGFDVLVVIFGYIKDVQKLPRLNTKILETIRRNLGIADLVKPTCFLFMAEVITNSIVL